MENEGSGIVVQKTTAVLLIGIFLVILVGGFIVFGTDSRGGSQNESPIDALGNEYSGSSGSGAGTTVNSSGQQVQNIYIKAKADGTYDTSEITVKKGIPVRLHFTTEPNVGCGSVLVLYGLNLRTIARGGQEGLIEFTPTQAGTYEYNCGMKMWQGGRLVVQ